MAATALTSQHGGTDGWTILLVVGEPVDIVDNLDPQPGGMTPDVRG